MCVSNHGKGAKEPECCGQPIRTTNALVFKTTAKCPARGLHRLDEDNKSHVAANEEDKDGTREQQWSSHEPACIPGHPTLAYRAMCTSTNSPVEYAEPSTRIKVSTSPMPSTFNRRDILRRSSKCSANHLILSVFSSAHLSATIPNMCCVQETYACLKKVYNSRGSIEKRE